MEAVFDETMYTGHRVVAMPTTSFGGLSIREVVQTRNSDIQPRHARTRSLSAGRSTTRPRDIVQDVYDRMGVGYTRGRPYEGNFGDEPCDPELSSRPEPTAASTASASTYTTEASSQVVTSSIMAADKFQQRYRAAAVASRSKALSNGDGRGRGAERETEGERRARSLSRGRSVSGRWPPNRGNIETENTEQTQTSSNFQTIQPPTQEPLDCSDSLQVSISPTANPPPSSHLHLHQTPLPSTNKPNSTKFLSHAERSPFNNIQSSSAKKEIRLQSPTRQRPSSMRKDRSLHSPTQNEQNLQSPAQEDRNLQSPTQRNRHLYSPTRRDRQLHSPTQRDRQLRSPTSQLQVPSSPPSKQKPLQSPYSSPSKRRSFPLKDRAIQAPTTPAVGSHKKPSHLSVEVRGGCSSSENRNGQYQSSQAPEIMDEKKDSEENIQGSDPKRSTSPLPSPSLRDRINAYAVVAKPGARAQNRPHTTQQYSKRGYTRAADLFEENCGSNTGVSPTKSSDADKASESIKDSPSVTVAKGGYQAGQGSANSVKSNGRSRSFLSTTHTPKAVAPPMSEIAATNKNWAGDGVSLAASDVSDEEINQLQKTAWQERTRGGTAPTNSVSVNTQKVPATQQMSLEAMEKIIEERVQNSIGQLETKMEQQLRRWLDHMDEKISARLDAMENKIQNMERSSAGGYY